MKTRVLCGLFVVAALPFLSSCSKDSPKPDPFVGVWLRDYYSLSDAPSTFNRFNGLFVPNPNSPNGIFNDESYTLTIKGDKTYTLNIAYAGPDYIDNGKWTKDTKSLTFTSTDTSVPVDEYTIEQDITSTQLVISQPITFNLLPDVVADSLTAWSDTHQSAIAPYLKQVSIKVTFHFNKK